MSTTKRRKKRLVVKNLNAPQVDVLSGGVHEVQFTIGSEAGNVINVALQLKDAEGRDVSHIAIVQAYLSSDSGGDGVVSSAPDGDIAVGTDGTILGELVADKIFLLQSEADGDIDLDIGHSAGATYYLCVIVPASGLLAVSGAITFT